MLHVSILLEAEQHRSPAWAKLWFSDASGAHRETENNITLFLNGFKYDLKVEKHANTHVTSSVCANVDAVCSATGRGVL